MYMCICVYVYVYSYVYVCICISFSLGVSDRAAAAFFVLPPTPEPTYGGFRTLHGKATSAPCNSFVVFVAAASPRAHVRARLA